MLIKEKLLGFKIPEFQVVFSNFLEKYHMDIMLIESNLGKSAFCPVTSQNGSGRHISKTKHARDLSRVSKNFLFLSRFLENLKYLCHPLRFKTYPAHK